MAVLKSASRAERLARGAMIAAGLSLVSCVLLDAIRPREPAFGFPHRVHVMDEGFDCGDCHMGVEDTDRPGMPVQMQCMLCHEDIDPDLPEDRRSAAFFVDGRLVAQGLSALSNEVIFSHLRHVEAGIDCAACHGDVGDTERILPEVAVSMDDCMSCHARTSAPNDCATCHLAYSSELAPFTHDHLWMEVHGGVVRGRSRDVVDRCSMCHTEETCSSCHQTEAPRDHTNFWRRRGHAFGAGLDRNRCATCHQPDSCNTCHADSRPISHVGSWGGSRSNHCLSCHIPLQSEGCYTCHKSTPSHFLAPPKPPDHHPAMDCRQCHGLTAPLLHADSGADCNACHQ
jgi:menaquinone reductase, multiheme cytochrome c subunit